MLRYWIFRSSVSCSTSHACPCTGPGRKTWIVNAYFCAREISRLCQQICVPLCKKIQVNNNHTAHWSMIQRLDIIEPNVILLCVPRCVKTVLLIERYSGRKVTAVPRVELQVEKQLVCTRTIRPRSNVRTKTSSLALFAQLLRRASSVSSY